MNRCIVAFGFCFVFLTNVSACTGVKARTEQGILVAANEDYNRTFRDIVARIYPAVEGRYGYIGTGFQQHNYFMMGLNDQGLFLDMFTVPPGFPYQRDPEKQDCDVFLEGRLLEECATVEEAVAFLQSYNHPGMVNFSYQIFVVDKSGASAVINWGDGGYEVVLSEGDHQVVTNFYLLHPELGYHPCWRYDTASEMMANSDSYSFRLLRDILDSVHLQSNFSQICNVSTGDVFVFDDHNFDEFVRINLYEALPEGYQEHFLPDYYSCVELLAPEDGEAVSAGNVVCEWRGRIDSDYRLVYSTNPDFTGCTTIEVSEAFERGGGGILLCASLFIVLFPFKSLRRMFVEGLFLTFLLCFLVSCRSSDAMDVPTGSHVTTLRGNIVSVQPGETVYWKIEADTGNGVTSESIVYSFRCGG